MSDSAHEYDPSEEGRQAERLLSIATAAIWVTCLVVSILGLLLRYPSPVIEVEAKLPPMQWVNVEVARVAPLSPPEVTQMPPAEPPPEMGVAVPSVPAASAPPSPPDAPPLAAVAAPSPAIAFALPSEGLARIVEPEAAGYQRNTAGPGGNGTGNGLATAAPAPMPPPPPAIAPPGVTRLTFGEGEGRQPPPSYPREAVIGHEEGTVGLRFIVGEDGRVGSVEVTSRSRWPLLNQAAVQAIRDTWRFNPGPRRTYEVPIQFQLANP